MTATMAPEAALEAAEADLEAAEAVLRAARRETSGRAAKLEGIGLDSGLGVIEIRQLADQVNLIDPATIEDAEIAAAQAALKAARARQAVLDVQRPALEAEKDRLEAIANEAIEKAREARNAWTLTLPAFSLATAELRDATTRLDAARRAAEAGAARRLAALTGVKEPPASNRQDLTQHVSARYFQ
jgi:hypothetical protein